MRIRLPGARIEHTSEGQAFFFEDRYGFAYVLNPTGEVLVEQLLAGDPQEDDLVDALQEAFAGVEPDRARADVRAFLQRLRQYGLLA